MPDSSLPSIVAPYHSEDSAYYERKRLLRTKGVYYELKAIAWIGFKD
ncbi:hypothetical protein [Microseira sp. BLCC-F43]